MQKDAYQLYFAVQESPVNVDRIEGRLCAIKEKLNKIEENLQLSNPDFKPFVPKDVCNESDLNEITSEMGSFSFAEPKFHSSFLNEDLTGLINPKIQSPTNAAAESMFIRWIFSVKA